MAESADEVAVVGAEAGASRTSSPWVGLVRLALGLALLGYVLAGVEWSELRGLTGRIDGVWLVVLVAMMPVTVALSVWKWRFLLRVCGLRPSGASLYGLYVLGQFYGHVLPTSVGGDVARGLAAGRQMGDTEAAFASIFVERLTGLGVLLALTALVLLVSPAARAHPMLLALAGATAVGTLVAIGAMLDERLLRAAHRVLVRFPLAARPLTRLAGFGASLRAYREHPSALPVALAQSLVFHAAVLVTAYAACRALGQQVPVATLVAATLLAQTIAVLPLSIAGIGLMEWAFVVVFAAAGLPAAAGAATMLAIRLNAVAFSCFGYLVVLMLQTRNGKIAEA